MLGLLLKRARQAKNLSQETVALRAGLSREYISLVERGKHSLTVDALLRVSRAIGINASNIIRQLEHPPKARRRTPP